MPYKSKHKTASLDDAPKADGYRVVAQALRSPPAVTVDRDAYVIGITQRPVVIVRPKIDLTDNQRAVLAELVHTLMDIPALPTKNLIGAIDHWFEVQSGPDVLPRAKTQATAEDMEPVVLIARPVDGV